MPEMKAYDERVAELKHVLEGQSLIFTPFPEADPVKFGEYMHADNDAWLKHMGGAKHPEGKPYKSLDPVEELAAMNAYTREKGVHFDFLLQHEKDGPYLGYANIMLSADNPIATLGYYILPPYRQHGVATEAASAIMQQLEKDSLDIGLDGINAIVRDDNIASSRVLEKAGFNNNGPTPSQFGKPGNFIEFVHLFKENPIRTR
jgi:RimJ/RimL family protein N-acetyltransferase